MISKLKIILPFAGTCLIAGVAFLFSTRTRAQPGDLAAFRSDLDTEAMPNSYIGSWSGNGVQDNPPDAWTILITISPGDIGSIVGTIAYPTLSCGGELTLQQVNFDSIELFEHITYGTNCVDAGTVTLKLDSPNGLSFAWEKEGYPGTASGSVARISSSGLDIPANHAGIWSGDAVQDIPPSQWTILIGLNNGSIGSVVGTVAYPSLKCGGQLTLLGVNTDSIDLFEDITYGTSTCVDEGTVTLSPGSANELSYYWEKEGSPATAIGSVTRISDTVCSVPFFSQRDEVWADHPLQTDGQCSPSCGTIGACGCTLTSATMLFAYFGANVIPPVLSDCMGTTACPFNWGAGAACSNNAAANPVHLDFSYGNLEYELNQNNRPVLLGMHRNGNLFDTHWVLVTDGSGDDPANYLMHDPWFEDGANLPLSIRKNQDYVFDRIVTYSGQPGCTSLMILSPFAPPSEVVPVVIEGKDAARMEDSQAKGMGLGEVAPSSEITGTVRLYRMTEVTMTLRLSATSTVGQVTEMQIWTDEIPAPVWQPFTNFVWLPWSPGVDTIYVRFKDEFGNISGITTDTTHPIYSPPPEPELNKLYLSVIVRQP